SRIEVLLNEPEDPSSPTLTTTPVLNREGLLTLLPQARIIVLHLAACNMKSNITLKLDQEILREARMLAAEQGNSVSSLLAAKLEELVRERKGYDRARKRALARLRQGFDLGWTPSHSRDELHER